jgi:uncharacterized protein (TIGR02444 family)
LSDAWTWSSSAWTRPGVEAICLDLQNRYGQCPPLLLWRLWTLQTGRPVTAEALNTAVTVTRAWNATTVDPLRAARRGLATTTVGIDDDGRLALRAQVRVAELAAERLLIGALERLAPEGADQAGSAADALLELAAAWGADAPIERLQDLVLAADGC